MRISLFLCVFVSSCLNSACMYRPMTNSELFGQTAGDRGPGLFLETPNGVKASATGNMGWELHGEGDKTTGKYRVDSILNSNVSDPLKQYPAWINSMAPMQQMNFQTTLLLEQELTKQYAGANEVIKSLGADAVKLVPTLFPNGIGSGTTTPNGGGVMGTIQSGLGVWNSLPPDVQQAIINAALAKAGIVIPSSTPVPTPVPANPN